jgi:hypothetical protein
MRQRSKWVYLIRNDAAQSGRSSVEYLLNFEQPLLYCALSTAPRAANVREGLIRTFQKYAAAPGAGRGRRSRLQTRFRRRYLTSAAGSFAVSGFGTRGSPLHPRSGAVYDGHDHQSFLLGARTGRERRPRGPFVSVGHSRECPSPRTAGERDDMTTVRQIRQGDVMLVRRKPASNRSGFI